MFEVVPFGNGWRWQMISADGRVLAYSLMAMPCSLQAAQEANRYRQLLWNVSTTVDHRVGACI